MTARSSRARVALVLAAAAIAVLVGALIWWDAKHFTPPGRAPDLGDPQRVVAGRIVYDRHCAACHGANLEGQPNWTSRRDDGRLPAPPHDDSGHTWHHPNDMLFAITKHGMKPPYAPADYASDMPAFAGVLGDDEIWNVLAYIQSRWSREVRSRHALLEREYRRQHAH